MCRKQQEEKMGNNDGMNYAPVGKPKPVVKPGEFVITAIYKAGFTDQVVKLPVLLKDEYYRGDGIQKNAIHSYKKGKALDCLSAEEIKVEAVQ